MEFETEYTVHGTITNKAGKPLEGLTVRIYAAGMRAETLLTETTTDEHGQYDALLPYDERASARRKTGVVVKVYSAKKGTVLYTPAMEDVPFTANPRTEINIVIAAALTPEETEFDALLGQLQPLIGDTPLTELEQSDQHQDIAFLAKETRIPSEKIEHLVLAHRLQGLGGIEAAFFYALLRQNTLLGDVFAHPLKARFYIDSNTDPQGVLYEAALVDAETIERDITAAAKAKIISPEVAGRTAQTLRHLDRFKKDAQAYDTDSRIQGMVDIVTAFIVEDKISEVSKLFAANKTDVSGVIKKITSSKFLRGSAKAKDVHTSLALGELLGYDQSIIKQVGKTHNIKQPSDIKRLARLNKADWKATLSAGDATISIAGKPLNKHLVNLHASSLARTMEKTYPSTAYAAQLAREDKPVFAHQRVMSEFLDKHEDFDLMTSNVDLYLKRKKLRAEEHQPLRDELKKVQRVLRLVPTYSKTNALLAEGIVSAKDITAVGKTRFIHDLAPKAGLTPAEATLAYKKAEATATAAMLIVGDLQDAVSSAELAAVNTGTLTATLATTAADFPNLKSLFKMGDMATCEHCRSVYSPAAYLVEILEFLDNRSVTDLTTLPTVTSNLAQDVLFKRRPDLGEIDLSCDNATTPVPYIDLACELLEELIAPDTGIAYSGDLAGGSNPLSGTISSGLLATLQAAGVPVTAKAQIFASEVASGSADAVPHYIRDDQAVCKAQLVSGNTYKLFHLRQTLLPAEELAAAPAYVNDAAYTKLKDASFAFTLPFDLNHTEAAAYFGRFDIDRAELMATFQQAGAPSTEAIAAEKLGLTPAERTLIATPDASAQQDYWNTVSATATDEMKVVDTFLTKTGLSYTELVRLLALDFIDPADKLYIKHHDLSSDTTQKEIAGLDDSALDRIHRFLRLQKKTGWKLETLDTLLTQTALGNTELNDATLLKLADLQAVAQKTKITIDELAGSYGIIPYKVVPEDPRKPLYHQIFLNKAKNGAIDPALLPAAIGTGTVSGVATSLAVALQVKAKDFAVLATLLPDDHLTFANISRLLLASRLLRKLKLSADDYKVLRALTGIDPSASPADTLAFVTAALESRTHSLKPAAVQFMLQHQAANATSLANLELKDATIAATLLALQSSYQAAFTASKSPFDPNLAASEQTAALLVLLANFPSVSPEDAETIAGFLTRTWTTPAAAKTLIDTLLGQHLDTAAIKSAIDTLAAVPANGDISTQSKTLLKTLMGALANATFLTAKQNLLATHLAATFKTDADLLNAVLPYAKLKQPAPGTDAVKSLLSTDSLIDTVNEVPVPPAITEAAFGKQYAALRLLHKLLPFVAAAKLEPGDAAWIVQHSADMGWTAWDSLPYAASQITVDYQQYVDFNRLLVLHSLLTPVENPADIAAPVSFLSVLAMTLPGSTATRTQLLEKIALLTGYDQDSLEDLDTYLFPAFALATYRQPAAWETLLAAAEYLRLLATDVAGVAAFIQPVLTAAEATALRMCLKSRYDEGTWLDTLKEVMDVIRPHKRDALVAYLLATHTGWQTTNDIYDHLLIDVEMESCMPSSRIVQAHGTIQLFVQRCLMGLEQAAAANVDQDSGWEQWKWMKNYRVWEANRKVFLYPENWIEAELRTDKSFLFLEMENELQQNELNEYTAEQGFIKYLEKLDDIAFLEIVATWYDSFNKTMHVFGRTKGGDPAIYYHRTFEQERSWTPWEKVGLEITGNHLLAFKRNNRLSLAWPIFSEEPDPTPQATMPNPAPGTVVNNEKPKRKLKIQLAVSEFANGVWQPKKVSKDAIRTPSYYTNDTFNNEAYTLMFFETGDQVWISKQIGGSNEISGTFNIAGCKGYPELASEGNTSFPDFFPDFKDTGLLIQRYLEANGDTSNDLAVRNALSPSAFYTILQQTPGTFRITYPHQMTYIDWVALLMEYLTAAAYGSTNSTVGYDGHRSFKIPLGTLLPYFMEDSKHAYVITPGFYQRRERPRNPEETVAAAPAGTTAVKRTGSDVLGLIEDILALFQKYLAKLQAGQAPAAVIQALLADEDYHAIVAELQVYGDLRYGEKFSNMYHPLICALRKTLYKDGVGALMKRSTQMQVTSFNFDSTYIPSSVVPQAYPIEDIDFASDGSYSSYNWELFFHAPFYIATQLTKNQKFEEALQWFHYIFNPTGALPGTAPQKYWVTKPFYLRNDSEYLAQRIDNLMYHVAGPNSPERKDLEFAIEEWREDPFKPHVVARYRTVAYQKALIMKYLDMLIEWGDYLFRQDTMESIAQATQMYVLADKLLGTKPRPVPPVIMPPHETYNQMQRRLDAFGNALIDIENILPDLSVLPEGGAELPPPPVTLSTLYFCIPQNEQLLAYWDKIADRLFKIRNCQNIDGVERSLALFAPPIDPGMLVKAAAAGLSISDVLAGLNAPLPYYRFVALSQKATEIANEVKALGNSLLGALEKKDAETIALLRSELELKVLTAVSDMKKLQIQESGEQIEILKRTQRVTEERQSYYAQIERISDKEQLNLDKLSEANDLQIAAQVCNTLSGVVAMIPDLLGGASGIGGSPHVTLQWGGKNLAAAAKSAGDVLSIFSAVATYEANRASVLGGYERRYEDWQFQGRLATKELASIEKQIVAAEIRKQVAETDLRNHEIQIDNAHQTDEFMRSKFTNNDLYQWMVGQISSVYFSAYKLAHDFAKKAERSYQFELGRDDSFISYGYWDSLKKGLLSADKLALDVKRMEASYIENNKREYEIVKHVSLGMLDPLALAKLKTTGACDFDIPEVLFDLDHAGQYFRRIKTVSVSLPCVAGPYTSISAKLSLVSNKYRKNTNPGSEYAEDTGNDDRFVYNVGAIQSIATSNGQKDNGMFELQFKDERYLPFEGTGAISSWRLELPTPELAQFNYDTIADVIVHVNYTAREGGSNLRGLAEASALDRLAEIQQELSQTGLHTAVNLLHDMPNEWHLLKTNGTVDLTIGTSRLPYMAQTLEASIEDVVVLAKVAGNPATFTIKLDGTDLNMSRIDAWGLCKAETTAISLDTPIVLSLTQSNLAKLEELVMVVKYAF